MLLILWSIMKIYLERLQNNIFLHNTPDVENQYSNSSNTALSITV